MVNRNSQQPCETCGHILTVMVWLSGIYLVAEYTQEEPSTDAPRSAYMAGKSIRITHRNIGTVIDEGTMGFKQPFLSWGFCGSAEKILHGRAF